MSFEIDPISEKDGIYLTMPLKVPSVWDALWNGCVVCECYFFVIALSIAFVSKKYLSDIKKESKFQPESKHFWSQFGPENGQISNTDPPSVGLNFNTNFPLVT